MGKEKRRDNLDHLLSLLGEKEYSTICTDYPDLVKPIEEFVDTRGLAQERTAAPGEPGAEEHER